MEDQIYGDFPSTARLQFRRWTISDAQFVLEMYGLKEVYQYLGSNPAPLKELSQAEAGIKRARASGMKEVHAVVYPANTKSLAVCDRLGMTRLGETTEWYKTTLIDHRLPL